MTISYELAKKLEDGGFPQPVRPKNGEWEDLRGEYILAPDGKATSYAPTLSELIEACGDDLHQLVRDQADTWLAITPDGHDAVGSTPEHAVALLWLALLAHTK